MIKDTETQDHLAYCEATAKKLSMLLASLTEMRVKDQAHYHSRFPSVNYTTAMQVLKIELSTCNAILKRHSVVGR